MARAQGIAVFAPTFRSLHKTGGALRVPFPGPAERLASVMPRVRFLVALPKSPLVFSRYFLLLLTLSRRTWGDGKKTREWR